MKRRIRTFRFIQRLLSAVLSVLVAGTMTFALVKYYTTKSHTAANHMPVWGTAPTLWPTFMLLAVALITLVLNVVTICAYCRSVEKANSTDSVAGYIGYGLLAVQVLAWAVSTGLFKMANTGRDLWGWSCGATADAIQAEVMSFLNFGTLCQTQVSLSRSLLCSRGPPSNVGDDQTGAFYITIVQAAVYVLTFVIYVWSMQRMFAKKKLERMRRLEEGRHGGISTTY